MPRGAPVGPFIFDLGPQNGMIGADDQVVTPALVLGASANQINEVPWYQLRLQGIFIFAFPVHHAIVYL